MTECRMRTIRLINNMKRQKEFAKEIGLENASHYADTPSLAKAIKKDSKEEKNVF